MVRPRSRMSRRSCQSSRRELGSMPEVGSSRNTTGASPRRQVATQRRRFWPPLRFEHLAWRFAVIPSCSSTVVISSSGETTPRSPAKRVRCSSTDRSGYIGFSWGHTDRFQRHCSIASRQEKPRILASPPVIPVMPVMQLTRVVLPAPLWPRSAKISPLRISSERSLTALWTSVIFSQTFVGERLILVNSLVSLSICMAGALSFACRNGT
mmetsp:Transcript_6464/g.11237  ORF Transcript_6464/g.11237 Transcript_6464/m.11237 type:complete len:210 (-) Transcript_6464:693-1322(-)